MRDVFRHETYFLYWESRGRIDGVLPLAHVKSLLFGQSLVSLPFAVYGGVAATSAAAAEALEAEAQRLAQRLGVAHLELRNVEQRHADWPRQDLYVTFRKAILPDEEANMLAIPRKQRAMVRKGIKHGLHSEIDAGVERFFPLYADNVHRHGTPALPRRYFDALLQVFGRDAEVLTVVAPDGRPLSSVLSFYFRDEVLPYYAGDHEACTRPRGQRLQVLGADAPRVPSGASRCSTTAAASKAPAPMRSRRTGASSRRRCTTSIACTSAMPFRRTTRPTRSSA